MADVFVRMLVTLKPRGNRLAPGLQPVRRMLLAMSEHFNG